MQQLDDRVEFERRGRHVGARHVGLSLPVWVALLRRLT
jgi:hypothetical protein